jgi:hypothetical protein
MTASDTQNAYGASAGTTTQDGRTVSIVGIVLGAISVLVLPLPLGIAGLVCGIVGVTKGNRLGYWAIGVSIICAAAGMAIGIAFLSGHHH